MPDVHVRGLTVEYETPDYVVRPLDNFDLDVANGSLSLLLGPSGCGKTTLLSCLGGILSPTAGWIRVGEQRVSGLFGEDLTDYRRHTVGIVFQGFNLVPSLSALENVAMPLRAAGWRGRVARERAGDLLDRVGLGDRADHRPSELSGGQQQRVAVARALALDPPLVLADEPTAHLDYIQVEEVLKILRDLAAGDRTVVVSTHDHRMIPLADRVVQMTPDFLGLRTPPASVSLKAGEVLFEQGSRGELIYVVEAGAVDIVRQHPAGREEVLATIHAGEYFGEMGPLFGLPRSATARAASQASVTGFTVRDFRERMDAEGLPDLLDHSKAPTHDRFVMNKNDERLVTRRAGRRRPRPSARPRGDAT